MATLAVWCTEKKNVEEENNKPSEKLIKKEKPLREIVQM